MHRDAVLDSVVCLDFPCLNTQAVVRAMEQAEAASIQPVAESLWANADEASWNPLACPAPLADVPALWFEWTPAGEVGEPAPVGVLVSTHATGTGFSAEAVVFVGAAPFLRYLLTYDLGGQLETVSVPVLAAYGGGTFVGFGWQHQAQELREAPEVLLKLSYLLLAPVLQALSLRQTGKPHAQPRCTSAAPLWAEPLDFDQIAEILQQPVPEAKQPVRHYYAPPPPKVQRAALHGAASA